MNNKYSYANDKPSAISVGHRSDCICYVLIDTDLKVVFSTRDFVETPELGRSATGRSSELIQTEGGEAFVLGIAPTFMEALDTSTEVMEDWIKTNTSIL